MKNRIVEIWQSTRAKLIAQDDIEIVDEAPLGRAFFKLVGLTLLSAFCVYWVMEEGNTADTKNMIPILELFGDGEQLFKQYFRETPYRTFTRFAYWSGNILLVWGLVPYLYARFVLGRTNADMGLSFRGLKKHLRIYLALYVGILVPLLLVSQTTAFQNKYPIAKIARHSVEDFLLWELIYLPQFVATEFFFRSFLLFPFAKRIGHLAVFIPLIPYSMIHFGKPVPEVFGAVFAGLFLGLVSYLTRSIFLGVGVHVAVALSMDAFAIIGWNLHH